MIRAIVVDDEPLARKRINALLASDRDISVERDCRNGTEAIEAISELEPDIVFLDVQMPGVDGFGVLRAIHPAELPVIVFVTAYDHYAVDAFTARALDFVLKPLHRTRFQQAVARAKEAVRDRTRKELLDEKIVALLSKKPDRLVIKADGRHVFIDSSDIVWVEAEGDYVRMHMKKGSCLLRETMHALEERLDPQRFIRVHRSVIVNVDCIKELHPGVGGDWILRLRDETDLPVSRNYRSAIQPWLDSAL